MIKYHFYLPILFFIVACSNSPDFETGEIKTFQILKETLINKNNSRAFVDSRDLLSRKQIDKAEIPILFIELQSGQNGTLTPYPGQGLGQTWLGADGATVTLDRGIIKASRGMGDDIMGSASFMPAWPNIDKLHNYIRKISYLSGNNALKTLELNCQIKKTETEQRIKVWDVTFTVRKYIEDCSGENIKVQNIYFIDERNVVRRSHQYHGTTIGYIMMERLDR